MRRPANVVRVDPLAEGTGRRILVDGFSVALFKTGGEIHAIDDMCVRCAMSLAAGRLRHGSVICAGCGWHYDLMSGRVLGLPALHIDRFEVRVVEMRIALTPATLRIDCSDA